MCLNAQLKRASLLRCHCPLSKGITPEILPAIEENPSVRRQGTGREEYERRVHQISEKKRMIEYLRM
jgi:hypothetical protein